MGSSYNYDTTGAIFSYFALTLLTLILLPLTYSLLSSSGPSKPFKAVSSCSCAQCALKSIRTANPIVKSKSSVKYVFLLAAWLLWGFVLYQASTIKMEEEVLWNPYDILGVDEGADERTVKKAFKKLSLRYHPDKIKEADKSTGDDKFIDISKAYKVLTDEEARALFDEFGHPDGKQAFELGLALPSWLVSKENSSLVLLAYALLFGIGLPVLVARWWRSAKVVSKNLLLNDTMGIFYRELNDNLTFFELVQVIAKGAEYRNSKDFSKVLKSTWSKYEKFVIAALGTKKSYSAYDVKEISPENTHKVVLLLIGHMLRLKPADTMLIDVQREAVETASLLIHGLLQIAQSRNWIHVSIRILDLSQLISQAMMPRQSELHQLPFMSTEIVKALKVANVASLQEFVFLDDSARKLLITPLVGDSSEITEVMVKVAEQYPRIELVKAEYSVYGDPVIVPSSLVTLSVKFRCLHGTNEPDPNADNEIPDPEVEKQQARKWWENAADETIDPHMPYFPVSKKPSFTVMLANVSIGRMICMQKVFGATRDHVVRLQFQSPPEVGSWTFQVYIKSDSFVGTADKLFDLTLNVSPATELPYENFDDTISEPEESIIGYEKPLKLRKVPVEERGTYDDSSDSDDQYDEDEEEVDENGNTDGFIE